MSAVSLLGGGIGSEALDFVKGWFYSSSNKTGCRFVIVDAVNDPQVLSFYEKNGFEVNPESWTQLKGSNET